MISLVIWWCLAGSCRPEEVPLPPTVTEAQCNNEAVFQIALRSLEKPGLTPGRWECVKGIRA